MSNSVTSVSLLQRVKDPRDEMAWGEFVRLYAPLVYSYGRKRGLQDSDAADLAQDVLRIAAEKMDNFQYDPARGSFRGWLLTVTLNQLRRLSKSHQDRGTGRSSIVTLLHQQPTKQEETSWDVESKTQILRWASEQVCSEFKPQTWQAFLLTAVQQIPAAEVASQLRMSVGSVYVAKSRVINRLREKVSFVAAE